MNNENNKTIKGVLTENMLKNISCISFYFFFSKLTKCRTIFSLAYFTLEIYYLLMYFIIKYVHPPQQKSVTDHC